MITFTKEMKTEEARTLLQTKGFTSFGDTKHNRQVMAQGVTEILKGLQSKKA